MTFNILDHLDKLTLIKQGSSYSEYLCPYCGCENFKVTTSGTRIGSYSCWNTGCSSKDIKSKLGLANLDNNYYTKPLIYFPSIKFPTNVFKCNIDKYIIGKTESYYSNKFNQRVIKTVYKYDLEHQVERIDYLEDGKKKKLVFPMHYLEGKFQYGKSNSFPLYNEKHLIKVGGIVYFVEGEKTADIFTSHTGLLTLTAPGFGWNLEWLQSSCRRLYWKIDGMIYIPDNDSVGEKKALLVQQAAWSCKIPCDIRTPHYSSFPTLKIGDDIADMITQKLDISNIIGD